MRVGPDGLQQQFDNLVQQAKGAYQLHKFKLGVAELLDKLRDGRMAGAIERLTEASYTQGFLDGYVASLSDEYDTSTD